MAALRYSMGQAAKDPVGSGPMSDEPPPLPGPIGRHPAEAGPCRFRPVWFFVWLLAPALLSMGSIMTTGMKNYGMLAFSTLVIGSVLAGIVCGVHFTVIQPRLSPGARLGLGVVSVIGCMGVAFVIGWGGCFALDAVKLIPK